MCDAVYCINQDSRQNTQNKKGRTIIAQRKKAALSLILVVLMAMWLTVNVFAATLNGNVASAPIGGRTYSAYNTITVSGNNARAGTSEDCNVVCAAGHLAVYPILQDIHGILLSSGWVYNTTTTNWFNASTSLYSATSGTLYSGGAAMGWNVELGHYTGYTLYRSPGLSIGSKSANEAIDGAYKINSHGQTYGVFSDTTKEYPDLVGAVGVDGTIGYVYSKDLFETDIPASPQEAVARMNDKEYIQGRLINLYANDGVTVIGQYRTDCLIGVTVQENAVSKTYHADGTISMTYSDGRDMTARWK